MLRQAHAAALSDPDLLAAAKRLELPIEPMDGAALADAVGRALAQPKATVTLLHAADSR